MVQNKARSVFATLLIVVANTAQAECASKANIFLTKPTQQNYTRLTDVTNGHVKKDCKDFLLKPTVNASLLRNVENGNSSAIKVLVDGLQTIDGGELEDAHRALGVSVEHNPPILFRLYAEKRMTAIELEDSLTMLPLSHVDDKQGTLARLVKRKAIVSSISETKLLEAKSIGLAALKESIEDVLKWPE